MLNWLRRPKETAPPAPAPAAAPAQPQDPDELMRKAFPLHEAGNVQEAQRLYREILRIKPDYADAHYLLGRLEQDHGRNEEAIPHLRNALRHNNREPAFHRTLGEVFYALGHWNEAIAYFHNAAELDPSNSSDWNNLGAAYEKIGQLAEASRHFEKALSISENSPNALNNVAMSLKDRGRVDEAVPKFKKACELVPDREDIFSNYLYCLNFSTQHTAAEVFREHLEFDRHFGTGRFGEPARGTTAADPERKLRIAYFSPDLRSHPVSVFIEPVLVHHDRRQVEVFCYYLHPFGDIVTERLKPLADQWVECRGLNDDQIADRLGQDKIDIVIDLAGHTGNNRLPVLGRKPAPVIVTWLGYPNTTGLKTVDYRLTDAVCDPEGWTEQYHTEALVRLPGAQWCFARPDVPSSVSALPALKSGQVRFGSFNNASKLTGGMLRLWGEMLRRVPDATLLVWGVTDEHSQRIRQTLQECGADPARLQFSDRTPFEAQIEMYRGIDIALDTFPYSGVTTTFNSVWMGVPVLTLVGRTSASRSTFSILSALGLTDWSATTEQELVETAVRKAGDLTSLARLRAGLRETLEGSGLMDGRAFAARLESAYREMWRAHCRGER